MKTREERFWEKVDRSGDCWLWKGSTGRGYGIFYLGMVKGKRKFATAHRFAYELAKGPIPEELVVDHLCRETRCVNPDHLEAVTSAENNRRSMPFRKHKGAPPKSHCRRGHPLTGENLIIDKAGRRCRICKNWNRDQTRRAQQESPGLPVKERGF